MDRREFLKKTDIGIAGSVVTKDVSDNMVVAGTPAKVIREIKNSEQ